MEFIMEFMSTWSTLSFHCSRTAIASQERSGTNASEVVSKSSGRKQSCLQLAGLDARTKSPETVGNTTEMEKRLHMRPAQNSLIRNTFNLLLLEWISQQE